MTTRARVTTRDIRTSAPVTSCDVCGRTLLRGERAQVYLDGSARRSVCELCISRAVGEGWVREGTAPPYAGRDGGPDRRRSLFGRLRRRRDRPPEPAPEAEEFEPPAPLPAEPPIEEPAEARSWTGPVRRARERLLEDPPLGRVRDRLREDPPVGRPRDRAREPRHVRAVPTSPEQKIASAVEVFNRSEHQRTVAGVARSLGPPAVAVRPVEAGPSVVTVVVSWELCWYRYAIDLSDDVPGVRVDAQGYELDELQPEDKRANAMCDAQGSLSLRAAA